VNVYFQLALTIAVALAILGVANANGYGFDPQSPVSRSARAAMVVLLAIGLLHWIWS
jgi:hypothetical protein